MSVRATAYGRRAATITSRANEWGEKKMGEVGASKSRIRRDASVAGNYLELLEHVQYGIESGTDFLALKLFGLGDPFLFDTVSRDRALFYSRFLRNPIYHSSKNGPLIFSLSLVINNQR